MHVILEWPFIRAFAIAATGVRYVPDWAAVGALASAAAAISAVAAIMFSVGLVRRQIAHQDALARAVAERERLFEVKAVERSYLDQVFALIDTPYTAAFYLISHTQAYVRKQEGPFSADAAVAPLAAQSALAGTVTAALNVLRASRARRFPVGTSDLVFARYEEFAAAVLLDSKRFVDAVLEGPDSQRAPDTRALGERVFALNQLFKVSTGMLIALMYGAGNEWNDEDLLQFIGKPAAEKP